jgi:hypothetical protein
VVDKFSDARSSVYKHGEADDRYHKLALQSYSLTSLRNTHLLRLGAQYLRDARESDAFSLSLVDTRSIYTYLRDS